MAANTDMPSLACAMAPRCRRFSILRHFLPAASQRRPAGPAVSARCCDVCARPREVASSLKAALMAASEGRGFSGASGESPAYAACSAAGILCCTALSGVQCGSHA